MPLRNESTSTSETKQRIRGGYRLSNVGICVLGLVFVISLTAVGLIVHFAEDRRQSQWDQQLVTERTNNETGREYSYSDFCQTWASSGRLSNREFFFNMV